jgi:hypothetical protein
MMGEIADDYEARAMAEEAESSMTNLRENTKDIGVYRDDNGNARVGFSQEFVDARTRLELFAWPLVMAGEGINRDAVTVLDTLSLSDALTPVIDPTAYRDTMARADKIKAMARALRTCVMVLQDCGLYGEDIYGFDGEDDSTTDDEGEVVREVSGSAARG